MGSDGFDLMRKSGEGRIEENAESIEAIRKMAPVRPSSPTADKFSMPRSSDDSLPDVGPRAVRPKVRPGLFRHLGALFKKTFFVKIRSPCSLACELLCPMIFCLFLTIGWALAGTKDFEAELNLVSKFSNINDSAEAVSAIAQFNMNDLFFSTLTCVSNGVASSSALYDKLDVACPTPLFKLQFNLTFPGVPCAHDAMYSVWTENSFPPDTPWFPINVGNSLPGNITVPAFVGCSLAGYPDVTIRVEFKLGSKKDSQAGNLLNSLGTTHQPLSALDIDAFLMVQALVRSMFPKGFTFGTFSPLASLFHGGAVALAGGPNVNYTTHVAPFMHALAGRSDSPSGLLGRTTSLAYVDALGISRPADNVLDSDALKDGRLYFPNPDDAVHWATNEAENSILAVVVLHRASITLAGQHSAGSAQAIDGPGYDNQLNFTIRMNYTATPITLNRRNKFQRGFGTDYQLYIYSGFIPLQSAILKAGFLMANGSRISYPTDGDPVDHISVPMPVAAYRSSAFLDAAVGLLPMVFVFGFLWSVSCLSSALVMEKESRIREAMFIMGLRRSAFYLHWLLVGVALAFLSSLLAAIVLKATFLHLNDFVLMFIVIFLFALSGYVALAFVLSSIFSKSRIIAIVAPLVFFLVGIIHFMLPKNQPTGTTTMSCLLPATAFSIATELFTQYQLSGAGLKWSDIAADDFSILACIFMMLFDFGLYLLLAWYLDQVIPSEYGVAKKPWFFLTPKYWSWLWQCNKSDDAELRVPLIDDSGRSCEAIQEGIEPMTHEQLDRVRLVTQKLRKEFRNPSGGGRMVAVEDLELAMCEGDISVMLGHNGAGKTTTISMLCGMMQPTSGDALIYGKSLVNDLSEIRNSLGFCPQHNVLWPNLTVREHLTFFCGVKGVPKSEVEASVLATLQSVKLLEKADQRAGTLSGGQKRKLSVGIALVGGSKVVFLDEPTAGMDVQARRATWDLLQREKAGRIMLLTTHYLDEAELLGNRVAILQKGRLHSLGSPLFLKKRLGIGYLLSFALICTDGKPQSELNAAKTKIRGLIEKYTPQQQIESAYTIVSDAGGELSVRVPLESARIFPDLFTEYDSRQAELGIRSYGVGVTTLEEVFLKIADDAANIELVEEDSVLSEPPPEIAFTDPVKRDTAASSAMGSSVQIGHPMEAVETRPLTGSSSMVQFKALMMKRVHCARRDRKTLLCMFFLPVIFILLAFLLSLLGPPSQPMLRIEDNNSADLYMGYGSLRNPTTNYAPADDVVARINATHLNGVRTTDTNTSSLLCEYLNPYKFGAESKRAFALQLDDTIRLPYFPTEPVQSHFTVVHNTTYSHSLPAGITTYFNGMFQALFDANTYDPVVTYNWPLPMSRFQQQVIDQTKIVIFAIIILIPYSFLPANFVAFIVKERESKAKHLQLVSGVSMIPYWLSSFVFDFASYMCTVALTFLLFLCFYQ